jgi:hypothetical protein
MKSKLNMKGKRGIYINKIEKVICKEPEFNI